MSISTETRKRLAEFYRVKPSAVNNQWLDRKNPVLTANEAAEILGYRDSSCIRRYAVEGRLAGFQQGKLWFFRWKDIVDFQVDVRGRTRGEVRNAG